MTLEDGPGTVKAKLRNKTIQALHQQMLKNTQFQAKGFGMPTEYIKGRQMEGDASGGDINNLISNQYEKEFIERAQKMDEYYQSQRQKHKKRVLQLLNTNSSYYETKTNKKRTELNKQKLQQISVQEERMQESGFSPQINPPMKKPLYTEDFIKKYLAGETGNQSLRMLESAGSQAQKITPRKPPIAKSKITVSEVPTSSHATTMASYTSGLSENKETVMPQIAMNSRNMQMSSSGQHNRIGNTQGGIEENRRGESVGKKHKG